MITLPYIYIYGCKHILVCIHIYIYILVYMRIERQRVSESAASIVSAKSHDWYEMD